MSNELNHMIPGDDEPRRNALQNLQEALGADERMPAEEAAFEEDAAEGLVQVREERLPILVDQLNAGLRRQLKKKKKSRHALPDQSFVYITVITVLILIVIAWLVLKKMHWVP